MYIYMRYKPRNVFADFHSTPWHRSILVCHRRCGKSYASAAETLKRAYNGPKDGQYLWCSPLAEQSVANVLGIFQTLDNNEGYIRNYSKTDGVISLANGAIITLGGARTAEKFRGRYLDGLVVDELSSISPTVYAEVLQYCLADRNGWAAFLGTARVDDGYRLYRMYQAYHDDPNWFSKMIGVNQNPEAFPPERVKEIYDEHIKYCLTNGLTMEQALQSFNVEFLCDFDFIDKGRPNMTALFYPELQNLFDETPPRILEPQALPTTSTQSHIATFDIQHSSGRDYTVCTITAETTTNPIVLSIEWENNRPWEYWFSRLRTLGIQTVALPFDAATTNKETMLTLVQTFKREGFNVIRIKRLLRPEQIENGRWLINNAKFSRNTIPALSEIGKFQDFSNKHGLEQDIVASFLYAAQVMRRKHIKIELANSIQKNYNDHMDVYDTGVSLYGTSIIGE